MQMNNDYYSIAMNDLLFMQANIKSNCGYYNNIATIAQQIAEKLLKSLVESMCPDPERLLKSHNLYLLATKLNENGASLTVDLDKLSTLKNFYIDARYPGDDFIIVSKDSCESAVKTVYNVVQDVNRIRKQNGLFVEDIKEILFPHEKTNKIRH